MDDDSFDCTSMAAATTLEEFFATASLANRLDDVKEITGATELEDLDNLTDEDLKEAGFKKSE